MEFQDDGSGDAPLGYGSAFGTFGELLQGVLPDDRNFLVTLPICRYTQATFRSDPTGALVVEPAAKQKSLALARAMLAHYGCPSGGTLTLHSDLPVGKGFASSSCDLVATARAIAQAFQLPLDAAQLETFMAQIEPSDGVMYDGFVTFFHREVRLGMVLGSLPPLTIVSADEGGEVDTIAFNSIPKPFGFGEKLEYQQLHDRMIQAFAYGDIISIGQIATRSAQLNQSLRPKALLNDMIELCHEADGLGVVVAHSGTVLGVLLTPLHARYAEQLAQVTHQVEQLAGNVAVYEAQTFSEPLEIPLKERAVANPV